MVLCIDFRFSDETKQIEVTKEESKKDNVPKNLTLLKCDGTIFVYNSHGSENMPAFDIANLHGVQVLDPRKHSTGKRHMIIMLKNGEEEQHHDKSYTEYLCETFNPLSANEEAKNIIKKRKQLDDLAVQAADILQKYPKITPRIRRYKDLIEMIRPLYEEVETEDIGIIQNCIDEINSKYEAEFNDFTAAKYESERALKRVRELEAKIKAELEEDIFPGGGGY